ncbi:MAG: hypothetical protein M9944_12675 [Rhizobiaceae bacterium]|nr:hypothetical protein [Rhizobiaceae bacterium]
MTHEEQNGLVEALRKELREARSIISATHRNRVVHHNCELLNCPICDGGLFQCADCGAVEVETETRICSAALQAPQEAGECATDGCGNTATGRFESGGVGSHHCPSCLAKIAAYLSTVEKPVDKWAIDNSTPSPILTYENCSVIQDEQAYYVLGLVRNAASTPPASATKGE